jgi:hypothetical protein
MPAVQCFHPDLSTETDIVAPNSIPIQPLTYEVCSTSPPYYCLDAITHVFVFASGFEGGSGSRVVGLGRLDCIAEHCVCLVTGQHSDSAFVVDLCVVHLLEVSADLFADSLRELSETSSILLESFLARTGFDHDLACEGLIVLGTDIFVVIAVLDFDSAVLSGWSSSVMRLARLRSHSAFR